MSDIDFLSDNKGDDQESKNRGNAKENITWSEPNKDKPLVKETAFSMLSFLKKKEDKKPAAEQKPVVEQKSAIDKDKIRESRREILRLIQNSGNSASEKKNQSHKSFLTALVEKFKRPPNYKKVLVDYQQIFNQEKTKRGQTGQVFNSRPAEEKELAMDYPARSANLPRSADKAGVASFVKAAAEEKPVRPGKAAPLAPLNPVTEEKPVKPVKGEKRAMENKKKSLERKEPAKIKDDQSRVLETNLIKGEIITFFDWRKKIVILINAILIPIFFIAALYFGFTFYQKQNQAKIQEQTKKFNELAEKIKQEEAGLKEITEFQARLKVISQIFAEHIYWTNFFNFLEDNTIKEIYYTGFSGDTSGVYSLNAIGSKFSNIPEQIDILRNNDKITDVQATGGKLTSGDTVEKNSVDFNLSFSVLKSIFTE